MNDANYEIFGLLTPPKKAPGAERRGLWSFDRDDQPLA
jgi:hypothetical protein